MAGVSFSSFAGQNWLITPAALAVNEARPSSVAAQSWLIEFSGVGILDLPGNIRNDWRHEMLTILPDVSSPLQFAINRHAIPVPTSIGPVSPAIVVEQIVPYAAISSALDRFEIPANYHGDVRVDFGFAVDRWRPNPFLSALDVNNHPVSNIFTGIIVDIAIRNWAAIIHRVSYQITIIGKIAFLNDRLP